MTKSFLKECLQQLKDLNFCYVYSLEQVDEVIKHCKSKVLYVPNECGYTIKKVKEGN